jgi:hypothetical protein
MSEHSTSPVPTAEIESDRDTAKAERICSWRAHPAAERAGAAVSAAALVVALAGAVYVSVQSIAWAVLAVIVLFLSLNRFFLPSRFEIGGECIVARYPLRTLRMPWADVRRFVSDDRGGHLSRRARPSRLDAYGGMHLIWPAGRGEREAVIRRIRSEVPSPELSVRSSNSGTNDVASRAARHSVLGARPGRDATGGNSACAG